MITKDDSSASPRPVSEITWQSLIQLMNVWDSLNFDDNALARINKLELQSVRLCVFLRLALSLSGIYVLR